MECNFCLKNEIENIKRCSRCKNAFYCSKVCQKQHWGIHKKGCVASKRTKEKIQRKDSADEEKGVRFEDSKKVKFLSMGIKRKVTVEKIENFMKWLQENGVVYMKKFKITELEDKGLGIIALEKIKKGESICVIPKSVIFDTSNVESIENGEFRKLALKLQLLESEIDRNDHALLNLIYHKFFLRERSFYWPYFEVLPSWEHYQQLPVNLSGVKLELLKGSLLGEYVEMERAKQLASLERFSSLKSAEITLEMVQWAASVLKGRGIEKVVKTGEEDFEGTPYETTSTKILLVPLCDFVNYGDFTSTRKNHFDAAAAFSAKETRSGSFLQLTAEDVGEREEILRPVDTFVNFCPRFAEEGFISNKYRRFWDLRLKMPMPKETEVKLPTKTDGSMALGITLPVHKRGDKTWSKQYGGYIDAAKLTLVPLQEKYVDRHPAAVPENVKGLMKKKLDGKIVEYLEFELRIIMKTFLTLFGVGR